MKNKEEKAQEAETRRPHEKPVLIIISTKESRGKSQPGVIETTNLTNGRTYAVS